MSFTPVKVLSSVVNTSLKSLGFLILALVAMKGVITIYGYLKHDSLPKPQEASCRTVEGNTVKIPFDEVSRSDDTWVFHRGGSRTVVSGPCDFVMGTK